MGRKIAVAVLLGLGASLSVVRPSAVVAATSASIIRVPADQPTIQAAIDSTSPGGEVVVGPGVYAERINFHGRAVTVRSAAGAETTVIDGGGRGAVVSFLSGEGRDSVLRGLRDGCRSRRPVYERLPGVGAATQMA